jgi:PiT family inorganic phosphate transporter
MLDSSATLGNGALLAACLLVAFGFEFVNGFHDTANAVATVIYTNSLPPRIAVTLSGIFNFAGVVVSNALGGVAVAMGILKLLPVELMVQSGTGAGLAMVLALLIGAILWNVGTWYMGLPASSSHTLIGAILGVGLASSTLHGHRFGDGVNLAKAVEIGSSLLISPLIGFAGAYGLVWLIRRYARNPALNRAPEGGAPPPRGTRALLVCTSCAVSFAHGQNDGQKGIGLVMLILMGLAPAGYALDRSGGGALVERAADAAGRIESVLEAHADTAGRPQVETVEKQLVEIRKRLSAHGAVNNIPPSERFPLRRDVLLADDGIARLVRDGHLGLDEHQRAELDRDRSQLRRLTDYAPWWVMMAIALSLGMGTMVGWKRIVVTVGERIGKQHLTYAQGGSAELVAASTILLASRYGLPVSTTHVLSSGVAGTMVAQGSGLNRQTVRNIALAWVLTLPMSMLLAGLLFLLLRAVLS